MNKRISKKKEKNRLYNLFRNIQDFECVIKYDGEIYKGRVRRIDCEARSEDVCTDGAYIYRIISPEYHLEVKDLYKVDGSEEPKYGIQSRMLITWDQSKCTLQRV